MSWYSEGLQFSCTQCGRCCSGPTPGRVWVTIREIKALAKHLSLTVETFAMSYLLRSGSRLSLLENAAHDCIFWDDDQGCTVYEVRPDQCRTFPFWEELVESPEAWAEESAKCPGMDSGRRYTQAEIEGTLRGDGEASALEV